MGMHNCHTLSQADDTKYPEAAKDCWERALAVKWQTMQIVDLRNLDRNHKVRLIVADTKQFELPSAHW
jgi:hypothetical protein